MTTNTLTLSDAEIDHVFNKVIGTAISLKTDPKATFRRRVAEALIAKQRELDAKAEPLGYMNPGHVHELQQKRLPYGYVYPDQAVGADVAIFTHPPRP